MHKILVVNDDAAMRLLYTDVFGDEGFDVLTASSGPDLMRVIEEIGPDLVVLDDSPLGKNGQGVVNDIRDRYKASPIIFSTNFPPLCDTDPAADEDRVIGSAHMGRLKAKIKEMRMAWDSRQGRPMSPPRAQRE